MSLIRLMNGILELQGEDASVFNPLKITRTITRTNYENKIPCAGANSSQYQGIADGEHERSKQEK